MVFNYLRLFHKGYLKKESPSATSEIFMRGLLEVYTYRYNTKIYRLLKWSSSFAKTRSIMYWVFFHLSVFVVIFLFQIVYSVHE